VNFKRIVEDVIETETFEQKEKRFLGWIIRSILNQNDAQKAAYNMFIRIFGFDPSMYKDKYIDGFQYFLINPGYNYFNEQQIKEIEKIAGVEFLSRFMGGNERIDLYDFFQNITLRFDLPEEKLIRIMGIVFKVVGERMAKRGHKDWEKLLFRKNLDKETDQAWGDILDNL